MHVRAICSDRRLATSAASGQITSVDTEASGTRGVTVFADYVCPFSYLASFGIERVADELGFQVEWRAFELRPAPMPPQAALTEAEWSVVSEVAVAAGIALQRPISQPRTRKAHEATKYAATIGLQAQLQRAIFAAHFREGRDIGRIDVLVEIAEALGVDRSAMKVALDVDAHAEAVVADAALARRLEIEGTPAFVAGDAVRLGYMSEDHLRDWLKD